MAELDKLEAGIRLAERLSLRTLAKIVLAGVIVVTVWGLWERRAEVTNALLSSVSAMIIMIMMIVGLIAYLALDGMIRDAEKRAEVVQKDMEARLEDYRYRIEQQDKRIDALIQEQIHDGQRLRETMSTLARLRKIVRALIEKGLVHNDHFPDSILGGSSNE